jgi:hypothetical protein
MRPNTSRASRRLHAVPVTSWQPPSLVLRELGIGADRPQLVRRGQLVVSFDGGVMLVDTAAVISRRYESATGMGPLSRASFITM